MATDDFQRLLFEISDLKRRVANIMRVGSVEEVWADKGEQKIRVKLGEKSQGGKEGEGGGGQSAGGAGGQSGGGAGGQSAGGKDEGFMSPWLFTGNHRGPHREETKYRKGQNVLLIAPDGDPRQAAVFPWAENDEHLRPDHASDNDHTYQYDKLRKTNKPDRYEVWLADEDDKDKQQQQPQGQQAGGENPNRGKGGIKDPDKKSLVVMRIGLKPDDEKDEEKGRWEGPKKDGGKPEGAFLLKTKKKGGTLSEDKAKAGQQLFEASDSIIFKVGGSTVTITGSEVVIKSSKIVTDGPTYLGDPGASKKIAARGSIDTGGDEEIQKLAVRVYTTIE